MCAKAKVVLKNETKAYRYYEELKEKLTSFGVTQQTSSIETWDVVCKNCLIYPLYGRLFGVKIYTSGGTLKADSLSTREFNNSATVLQHTRADNR